MSEPSAQIRQLLKLTEDKIQRLRAELATELKRRNMLQKILHLPDAADGSNIDSKMLAETEGKSRETRISAGRATIDSDSRRAAVAADWTDGTIATFTGASRQAVQKWHTGKLAIPRRHAEKLARPRTVKGVEKPGIPLGSWRRIAD